jgi:hypothetical protein
MYSIRSISTKTPAFPDLGTGNVSRSGLVLQRHGMDFEEGSGLLQGERSHGFLVPRTGPACRLSVALPHMADSTSHFHELPFDENPHIASVRFGKYQRSAGNLDAARSSETSSIKPAGTLLEAFGEVLP